MDTTNTKETAFTHAVEGVDRRWQWCQCVDCGKAQICTPRTDFYAKDDGDPLKCEACFTRPFIARGLTVIKTPFPSEES